MPASMAASRMLSKPSHSTSYSAPSCSMVTTEATTASGRRGLEHRWLAGGEGARLDVGRNGMRGNGSEVSRARAQKWRERSRPRRRRGGCRARARGAARARSLAVVSPVRFAAASGRDELVGRGTRGRTCLEMRRWSGFAAGAAKAERAMEAMVAMDVPGVVLAERGVDQPHRLRATWQGGYRIRDLISAGSALRFLSVLLRLGAKGPMGASRLAARASPHTASRARHGAHHRALRRGVPGGAHRGHLPHRRLPQVRRQQGPSRWPLRDADPTPPRDARRIRPFAPPPSRRGAPTHHLPPPPRPSVHRHRRRRRVGEGPPDHPHPLQPLRRAASKR